MVFLEGAERSLGAWMNVWLTSMGVTCAGATVYALTASGNIQPWNDGKMSARQQWDFERKQFSEAFAKKK